MDGYTFTGSLLIGVAIGWLTVAVGLKWVAVRRQQKADEQRVVRALQQAFAERRMAWEYDEIRGYHRPIAEQSADAYEMAKGAPLVEWTPPARRTRYTIVPGSENPIGDGLVVDYFRKELDGGWKS